MANKCDGCKYQSFSTPPDVCMHCKGDPDVAEDRMLSAEYDRVYMTGPIRTAPECVGVCEHIAQGHARRTQYHG